MKYLLEICEFDVQQMKGATLEYFAIIHIPFFILRFHQGALVFIMSLSYDV